MNLFAPPSATSVRVLALGGPPGGPPKKVGGAGGVGKHPQPPGVLGGWFRNTGFEGISNPTQGTPILKNLVD